MRIAAMRVFSVCAAALAAAACGGGDNGGVGSGGDPDGGYTGAADIEVTDAQEQSLCDILASDPGTGPVPANAAADTAGAPAIDVTPVKMPVHLTDFGGQHGGYLRIAPDPAADAPVVLMIDAAMPVAALAADGTAIDFDDAAGLYTWVAPAGDSYLAFGPTDTVSFDLVIEVVE